MSESLISAMLFAIAIIALLVGVCVLFGRGGQPLSLDMRGFGIQIKLRRNEPPKESNSEET